MENGEAYNVGNDEMISIKNIVQKFIKKSKLKVKLKFKLVMTNSIIQITHKIDVQI